MKRGIVWAVLLAIGGIGGVWSVNAATFNSSNYSINGNLGDSAAGGQSSTNYQLTSAAGESIAGQSSSTSYKLGQGYVPTLENSMQVITQPSGLAGYWPLDNSAPNVTAFDESANANNGTYSSGSATYAGKVGSSWSEFTTTEQITVPHSASLPSGNVMTVSGWIRKPNPGGNAAIMSKWTYNGAQPNDGSWAFQLSPSGSELRAFIRNDVNDPGNNYVDSTNASLANDTWYHVAMVYDGTQAAGERVKLFLNGTQLTTSTSGSIATTMITSTTPLVIGNFPGLNRYWNGAIDEAKLYGRAMTISEIKAEYDAGNAGVPAGLGLGGITPGAAQMSAFDSVVQTSAGGYSLAINQDADLTSGAATIPAVGGSIGSPVAWDEGVTKGLGFTLFGTNATAIPGAWGSGANYAAIPGLATTFYSRIGHAGGTKDIVNMRLRADVSTAQPSGSYSNQMIITGTMIP